MLFGTVKRGGVRGVLRLQNQARLSKGRGKRSGERSSSRDVYHAFTAHSLQTGTSGMFGVGEEYSGGVTTGPPFLFWEVTSCSMGFPDESGVFARGGDITRDGMMRIGHYDKEQEGGG